jgi:hypothetical protein
VAVAALHAKLINPMRNHRAAHEIGPTRYKLNLSAISGMLVEPCEDVKLVFPASEDGQVTGGVSVGLPRSGAAPVAPVFRLDVAVGRFRQRLKFDDGVARQAPREPHGVVTRILTT